MIYEDFFSNKNYQMVMFIDKNVDIPPYTKIGVNREEDIARGFYVSQGGVTVVPKNAHLT